MIRVTKAEKQGRTTVTIDGELSREAVEAVEICCDQALYAGKPVDVFLRDVSTVDQAGRALLRRFSAKGIKLRANGIYNSYLLRTSGE